MVEGFFGNILCFFVEIGVIYKLMDYVVLLGNCWYLGVK